GSTVIFNTADYYGGGLYVQAGKATLNASVVSGNVAQFGGGLYLYSGDVTLSGNTVASNAADYGGGLHVQESDATLINTVVADNQAQTAGSGLYIQDASPRLLHTTIARNSGGNSIGLCLLSSGNVALTNTILVGHATGVYVAPGTSARLEGTLWGNTADWDGGGTLYHDNDYTGEPAFVDPDGGDYHIEQASAARDKGVDAGVASDIDGDPRPVGLGSDLGADEWTRIDLSPSRKSVNLGQAEAGDTLTYTLVLSNGGLTPSMETLLFDAIPAHTTYISGSAQATSGALTDGDGIRWTGVVTPHRPITITFRVTVNAQAFIHNTAIVTDQHGAVTVLTALVNARRLYLPIVKRET
ncbi:MAG TPA: DUF11 domain-containing protein, partial [Chloroflexi bacterium]|nr:DUF11 domain-containing protein [Chloroflexota bacterium]